MKYSFCDLVFEIIDAPCLFSNIYDSFRVENDSVPNRIIQCFKDENLTLVREKLVFECTPGTKVYQDSDGSFLYYYEMEKRLLCRFTNFDNVLRYRVFPNAIFTELDMINSLFLDSAMEKEGRYLLHSSFIHTKYGAVLFTAPSGTGKSTQAELWRRYRCADVINGDRSCVWKSKDTWMAGGAVWCGTSGIMKNESYPLAAIVVLKQGPTNCISKMRMISKIARMMEQTTINDWDELMYQRAQEFWIDTCENIPIFELTCTPDERAVQILEEELEKIYG